MKQKIFYFVILIVFPLSLEAATECQQWVARVASIQGRVEMQQTDSSIWVNVKNQDTLCPGYKIRTRKNSRATLELSNESLVTLDQKTTLVFSKPVENFFSRWLDLIRGSTFFRSRQPHKLEIRTPFVNAVHEGTEFLVSVNDEQAAILVFDGQVSAVNKTENLRVKKGFKAIAAKGQALRILPITIRPEDAVQWTLYYPPLIDYQNLPEKSITAAMQEAIAQARQGEVFQAIETLNQVSEQHRDAHYATLKASLYLSVGRVDEAEKSIELALTLDSNNGNALALLTIIAITKNQQDKALELALQAVELSPRSDVAKIALSYAYQAKFAIEQALQAAQQATQLGPNNALAWARLAELQLSVGERSEALASAEKAEALNPDLAKTHIILGFAKLAQIDITAAKDEFTEALALDSADPLARLGLGLAKIRKGKLKQGTRDLEMAVSLDPDNAMTRSYLGKANYQLKNYDYAETELSLAKQIDPYDPTPWAYDAILKQATTRPVEALYAIEKAIELNDNRAIFRSRFLLDEDFAIRGISLARIYDDLGFEYIATLEAAKSLDLAPSNHSAHRFLSDSYATQPRLEIARASELLQSQLLQPVNLNPIQPRLAITDLNIINGVGPAENTFNEYNRVFEGNGSQFTATGIFGNNSTFGDEAVLSGIYDKFSYSLGQLFYTSDGFRENNDLHHNLYDVFAQYAFSSRFNVQAEYRYRKTRQGDLELTGSPDDFSDNQRREREQNTYRLGFRLSPDQTSDFLVSAIYATKKETLEETQIPFPGFSFAIEQSGKQSGYQVEGQYLFRGNQFNAIAGSGAYLYDVEQQQALNGLPQPPDDFRQDHYFGYLYTDINLLNNLTGTLGLSYDSYNESRGNGQKIAAFNPKVGLRWLINDIVTLRAAAFRTIKSPIIVNQVVQPTQVVGFNQFYDDLNGTKAMQYSFGLDAKFTKSLFSGVEFFYRDLDVPAFNINLQDFENRNNNEQLYRVYLNWAPHINWSVNSEFRYEQFHGDQDSFYDTIGTAYIPLSINYYHTIGAFAELGGTYVHQNVVANSQLLESFTSDFFLLDAAIGYRLPKQYGVISLEGKNLLNRHFKFRDRNFQMNEIRASEIIPELTFMARITFNFSL